MRFTRRSNSLPTVDLDAFPHHPALTLLHVRRPADSFFERIAGIVDIFFQIIVKVLVFQLLAFQCDTPVGDGDALVLLLQLHAELRKMVSMSRLFSKSSICTLNAAISWLMHVHTQLIR